MKMGPFQTMQTKDLHPIAIFNLTPAVTKQKFKGIVEVRSRKNPHKTLNLNCYIGKHTNLPMYFTIVCSTVKIV